MVSCELRASPFYLQCSNLPTFFTSVRIRLPRHLAHQVGGRGKFLGDFGTMVTPACDDGARRRARPVGIGGLGSDVEVDGQSALALGTEHAREDALRRQL